MNPKHPKTRRQCAQTKAHAPYTSLHTLSLIQLPLDVEVNVSSPNLAQMGAGEKFMAHITWSERERDETVGRLRRQVTPDDLLPGQWRQEAWPLGGGAPGKWHK